MPSRPDAELWSRAWELAEQAGDRTGAELEAWLAEQTEGQEGLRQALMQLLDFPDDEGPREAERHRFGPYETDRLLGSGGMGRVYRGRHAELGQLAAVKVVTLDSGASAELERFQREMRLLAKLEHPGIVGVYQSGSVEEPAGAAAWFAMELVKDPVTATEFARTITEPAELLRLALELTDAVAHAHACGVVHRDLKPSNLLVDAAGRARVIDFGVARAVEAGRDSTDLTVEGSVVGTLNYIAPECLRGEQASERSDVYALGLVLEELVTGQARFAFSSSPFGVQSLREAQRRAPPRLPQERVPGETEGYGAIVAKATDPRPEHRYEDAGELNADLRRLRDNLPLTARPVSGMDRARLFAMRHRGLVQAATVVMLTLIAGLLGTSFALLRASRAALREAEARQEVQRALERESQAKQAAETAAVRAQREADANGAFAEFLQQAFTRAPAGVPYTVEEALENAVDQIEVGRGDPLMRGRALELIGSAFVGRGLWERADGLLTEAVEQLDEGDELYSEAGKRALVGLHGARVRAGALESAKELEAFVLGQVPVDLGHQWARLYVINYQAIDYFRIGREDLAAPLFERVTLEANTSVDAQRDMALSAKANGASCLAGAGRVEEAMVLMHEVWDWRSEHQPDDPRSYRSAQSITEHATFLGRAAEAFEFSTEALCLAESHGLDDRLETFDLRESRAKALIELGQHDRALAIYERCLADRRSVSGDRDYDILVLRDNLANLLMRMGRYERARGLNEATYVLRSEVQGPEHYLTLYTLGQLGHSLGKLERFEEALPILEEAEDGLVRQVGATGTDAVHVRGRRIECLAASGHHEAALRDQRELVADLEAVPDIEQSAPVHLSSQCEQLALMHLSLGSAADALAPARRAVDLLRGTPSYNSVQVRTTLCKALLANDLGSEAAEQHDLAVREAEHVREQGGDTSKLLTEFEQLFNPTAIEASSDVDRR